MQSSSYVLSCTVCRKSYSSNDEWLSHLLLKSHQDLAGMDCGGWGEEEMECCVVIFCGGGRGYPRLPYSCVLKYFSNLGCGLVTNFLWWAERRNVLIVEFESKVKVDKLFTILKGSEAHIQDQVVHLRRLMEYMTLERQCLFPEIGKSKPAIESQRDKTASTSLSGLSSVRENKRPPDLESRLIEDFQEIRNTVVIPNDQFKKVLKLMKSLQKILGKHFSNCQLYLFRHWYLKLKTVGTNELLIYLKHDKILETTTTMDDYKQIFQSPQALSLLPDLQVIELNETNVDFEVEPQGKPFFDGSSGIRFSIVDFGFLSTEMQTCQLLKHLCTLDERVRPLLTLIMYWAIKNELSLQTDRTTPKHRASHSPMPSALEWLVIFFLSHENVIPTIKQLMKSVSTNSFDRNLGERLQEPRFPMGPDFNKNPFLNEDKSPKENADFVLSIVRLLEKFFSFYGDRIQNEMSSPVILNTRNGEIILAECSPQDLVGKKSTPSFHFKGTRAYLEDDEKNILKTSALLNSITHDILCQSSEVNLKTPIFILHPLFFRNCFPLDPKIMSFAWRNMRETAEKLRRFLEKFGNCGSQEIDVSLKQILNPEVQDNRRQKGRKRKKM